MYNRLTIELAKASVRRLQQSIDELETIQRNFETNELLNETINEQKETLEFFSKIVGGQNVEN